MPFLRIGICDAPFLMFGLCKLKVEPALQDWQAGEVK